MINATNKKLAVPEIGFADSEYICLQMNKDDVLTIYLNSWEEKTLKIIFVNVIQFSYKLGDIIKEFYSIDNSVFLKEALSKKYIRIPMNHPFKLFQIVDVCDFPFIEVVAESVSVIRESFADTTK